MELVLRVMSYNGLPPQQAASVRVADRACVLGRHPGSDLELPDPECLVSGRHAVIERHGQGFLLTDMSTNGTFLNEAAEAIPPHQPVALSNGDRLGIGTYVLSVSIEPDGQPSLADPFASPDAGLLPGLPDPGASPDIMELLGPGGGAAPAPGHLFGQGGTGSPGSADDGSWPSGHPTEPRAAEPPRASVENIHFSLPKAAPERQRPVGGPPSATPPPTDLPPGPAAGAVPELPPEAPAGPVPDGRPATGAASSIPDDYDLLSDAFVTSAQPPAEMPPARAPEPVAGEAPGTPTPAAEEGVPPGPDLVLPPFPEDVRPMPGPVETVSPELPGDAFVPVAGRIDEPAPTPDVARDPFRPAQPPQTPTPPARAAAVAPGIGAGSLPRRPGEPPPMASTLGRDDLGAFLAGLGSGEAADIRDPEQMLRTAGALLRVMTEGLMAVMMARASFKSELRLEVTTIRSRENNPFQFCVGADDALERLLWRPSRGFLDPTTAARKSFDDIQAHQMAMIAGLRAALKALLARFDPARLEKHLEGESQLDRLLPMARKSRCWDQFVATFDRVAEDGAEDFMRLFGDAFNRAYEDQVRRLMEAQRGDSS